MNSLKTPVIALVVILIALCAWFFYAHQSSTPVAQVQSAAATTSASEQSITNSAPALSESAVAGNLSGTWQSSDDPNYSVVITADGKWTDRYASASSSNDVSETGAYTLFTSANPDPAFSGPLASGVIYLKLVEGSATYFYSVIAADGQRLQLSYLARGDTLSFVRAQ